MSLKHTKLWCLLMAVAGCSPQYDSSLPLQQQLAGKSAEEKRTLLRGACLTESEKLEGKTYRLQYRSHTTLQPAYSAWVADMKSLCIQMSDNYASGNAVSEIDMAAQCDGLITQGMNKKDGTSRQHAQNMHHICEALTGDVGKRLPM